MTTVVDEDANEFSSRRIFYPLLILASAIWLYHRWQQQTRLYRLGNKLPGPMALPVFGNALMALFKNPEDFIKIAFNIANTYGYVVRGWIGSKLIVFLSNPEDVEVILNSHVHIDKAKDYKFFEPWLGEGLLISSGEKWRYHRKIIAPTFHINILKSFIDVFNENSKSVVEKLRKEVGKNFDVHDHMSEVTVDILLETAMGITKKTHDKSGYEYAMAVMKMCDIIHQRHYKFWLRLDFMFWLHPLYKTQQKLLSIIHGLTNKVISIKKKTYAENKAKGIIPRTIQELTASTYSENIQATKTLSDTVFKGYRDDLDFNDENDVGEPNEWWESILLLVGELSALRSMLDGVGEKKRLAFLDLMIESAQNGTNKISDHEIKEEVDTIMFEGHDTTAAGSSFVLCLLGVHHDVQSRVYDELYQIFGDSDRPATFLDTLEMKYLERVILESLRLYPPVPIIAREVKSDVQIKTNKHIIPAGATVVICQFGLHRHPAHYKDPDTFNPDNFLPENTQNRHYYSYIPFSAGPRSCVGRKYALLKLKILLSTILRNYKCISDIPEEKFRLTTDIILKRSDGFNLRLEPRTRVPSTIITTKTI